MTPATLRRHTIELRTMACGTYAPALGVRVSVGKSINSLINHNKTSLAPRRGIAPIIKIKHLAKSGKDFCSVSFREFPRRSFPPVLQPQMHLIAKFFPCAVALCATARTFRTDRDNSGHIRQGFGWSHRRRFEPHPCTHMNFAGGAKKVTVPGVPEPTGWTEMRAREAITRPRCTDRFKLG